MSDWGETMSTEEERVDLLSRAQLALQFSLMPFGSCLLAFCINLGKIILCWEFVKSLHIVLSNHPYFKKNPSAESNTRFLPQKPELHTTFVQSPQICIIKQVHLTVNLYFALRKGEFRQNVKLQFRPSAFPISIQSIINQTFHFISVL